MSFLKLSALDTQTDELTAVPLADVATDLHRYELLGPADSSVISDPAQGGGTR
ncbi:MAG: hypothetical protein ACRDOD_22835 [Streptosporangiaceae bacterium]